MPLTPDLSREYESAGNDGVFMASDGTLYAAGLKLPLRFIADGSDATGADGDWGLGADGILYFHTGGAWTQIAPPPGP